MWKPGTKLRVKPKEFAEYYKTSCIGTVWEHAVLRYVEPYGMLISDRDFFYADVLFSDGTKHEKLCFNIVCWEPILENFSEIPDKDLQSVIIAYIGTPRNPRNV